MRILAPGNEASYSLRPFAVIILALTLANHACVYWHRQIEQNETKRNQTERNETSSCNVAVPYQYEKTSIEQEQATGMAIQRCESKPSVTDLNDCFPWEFNECQAIKEKAAAVAKKALQVHFPTVCSSFTSKQLYTIATTCMYSCAFITSCSYCTLNAQLHMLYITRLRERA